jgi:segregation and condensation protein B
MIRVSGRKNVVGSPFLYRTTKDFLVHFGLNDIRDLPRLEEFGDLIGENINDDLLTAISTASPASSGEISELTGAEEARAEVEALAELAAGERSARVVTDERDHADGGDHEIASSSGGSGSANDEGPSNENGGARDARDEVESNGSDHRE